jgi:hypothetical protein
VTPTITTSPLPYVYEIGSMVPCCSGSTVVNMFVGSNIPLNLGDSISINLGGGVKCYQISTTPTLLTPPYPPIVVVPVVTVYLDCETCITTYPCV